MSEVFRFSAQMSGRKVRSLSPQPSTSSAPVMPLEMPMEAGSEDEAVASASASASAGTAAPREDGAPPADSVYSHVTQNISNIQQLRGLRSGRRHGRWRRLHAQSKVDRKYGEMIKILGPLLVDEMAKQQGQHVLITAALDHFANTVNAIVDKFEGKKDTSSFAERLEAFKKKVEERRELRRLLNPDGAGTSTEPQPPPPPKLSEEEINRRLREETEAAVEALLTGDKSKEKLPDTFAHILEAFKMG